MRKHCSWWVGGRLGAGSTWARRAAEIREAMRQLAAEPAKNSTRSCRGRKYLHSQTWQGQGQAYEAGAWARNVRLTVMQVVEEGGFVAAGRGDARHMQQDSAGVAASDGDGKRAISLEKVLGVAQLILQLASSFSFLRGNWSSSGQSATLICM